MRHMGTVHSHDPHFHVCCGVHGCPRTYTNFESFRKHLYRRHRCDLDLPLAVTTHGEEYDETLDDTLDDNGQASGTAGGINSEEPPQWMQKRQTALFLMKAREVHKISQVSLDGLLADFTEMRRSSTQYLESEINKILTASGLRMDDFEGLRNLFCQPEVVDPFHGLQSRFLQEKFYKEHFGLVVKLFVHLYVYCNYVLTCRNHWRGSWARGWS